MFRQAKLDDCIECVVYRQEFLGHKTIIILVCEFFAGITNEIYETLRISGQIDDFLVTGKSCDIDTYLANIERLVKSFRDVNLKLSLEKSVLLTKTVTFLGKEYTTTPNGATTVRAAQKHLTPANLT